MLSNIRWNQFWNQFQSVDSDSDSDTDSIDTRIDSLGIVDQPVMYHTHESNFASLVLTDLLLFHFLTSNSWNLDRN